ncbi:undecaprenyl-diphosphate phosphatase [Clostridium sp. 19966]|uniref:undecaprenyl-diphosphate phosphatase n=1 Tax=Clostridium sp. 19966 TaxID=2768166 RepID=UPI0028E08B7A|nr:undecaprenyl-diphosphate phosphatase [Clostridium sp. 19966]MDT8719090.1 undecaprenyl-diphosphate phosphatase [Clostridium sp. 19966]
MDLLFMLKAVIIGIVEGITEFLPISSTGHMIIAESLIGFNSPYGKEYANLFTIVIQLGAILAIVVLYWEKIKHSFTDIKGYGFKLWSTIIIGFLPAAVLGFLLDNTIDAHLMNAPTVIAALIIGAILMIYMENKYRKKATVRNMEDVTYSQAIKIGFFQCLAMWPGMSRSASTIMGGWFTGLDSVAASEFSFFLAIPTMVGATGLKLIKALKSHTVTFNAGNTVALIVGFVIAFLVALVVVEKFIAFLKKKPMRVFAIYRIFIGILLLILAAAKLITI